MRDPRDDLDAAAEVAPAVDSHGSARKPRRKAALLDGTDQSTGQAQNALDVRAAVPLHLKLVLTYAEADALGISPERSLRRLVAMGRVKRSVIRNGRHVRFVVQDLLDELRQAED